MSQLSNLHFECVRHILASYTRPYKKCTAAYSWRFLHFHPSKGTYICPLSDSAQIGRHQHPVPSLSHMLVQFQVLPSVQMVPQRVFVDKWGSRACIQPQVLTSPGTVITLVLACPSCGLTKCHLFTCMFPDRTTHTAPACPAHWSTAHRCCVLSVCVCV